MNKSAKELLDGYKQGTLTPEEKLLVENWFIKQGSEDNFEVDEAHINQVKAEMWEVIDASRHKMKTIKWWPRIVGAAAAILVVLSAGLFYLSKSGQTDFTAKTYTLNDFAPGKNRAILMLGNGKVITLSDHKTGVTIEASKLVYNDGTNIVDETALSHNNNQIMASTPRGGTYQVILPDGTRVWLNSSTKLKFPSTFSNLTNRTVELSGEAYFEVSRDAAHPFIVKTASQHIQVLGTHFNVNAYPDERNEKTVLLEGRVQINNSKVLVPGQQSQVDADGHIKIETADIDDAMAWKNGFFSFKDAPLEIIMRQLSRWYNIDIVYKGELKDDTFNGLINRRSDLSRALKILEQGGVHFSLEGKTLIITP
jgi:transmembrane sensor